MKVRAIREFYGHPAEVRAGDEITVSKSTGAELVANGLVEIVDEADEEEDVEDQEEKAKEPPANKAAQTPKNKAAEAAKNKD